MNSAMKKLTGSLLSLLFLASCGGGVDSNKNDTTPTTPSPVEPVPTQPTPTPDPLPIPDPTPTTVEFDIAQIVPFSYTQLSAGQPYNATSIQSASFSNASGTIYYPPTNSSVEGNLVVSVDVVDPDGIKNVYIGFADNGRAFKLLCANDCGTEFHQVVTGINPLKFGAVQSGNQRLELWVEDNDDNRVFTESVVIDWQPVTVTGISATPSDGNLLLQWDKLTNYLRYNVYLATSAELSIHTYQSMELTHQVLALRDNSLNLTDLQPDTVYYVMVIGIDGGGESAFSEPMRLTRDSGLNATPIAVNDTFDTLEDQVLTGNLISNDSDADEEPLTANTTPVTDVENGELTINGDGTFNYTPSVNFSGIDMFAYQISDGAGATAQAVVTINISAVDDTPEAMDNAYNMRSIDGHFELEAPGLLANDYDIDVNPNDIKNTQTIRVNPTPVAGPEHGELQLNEDGSFNYVPQEGFSGEDQFTYQIITTVGKAANANRQVTITTIATAVITVDGDNNQPIATNDLYVTDENTVLDTNEDNHPSILANDIDNDGDTLTLVGVTSGPDHGILNLGEDGHLNYLPNANFYGIDLFVYQVTDGQDSTRAAVTIIVLPTNDAPVALPDQYELDEDTSLSVSAESGVLANDSDVNEDTLTVTEVRNHPSFGQVTMNPDGSFIYVPQGNFTGTDSFVYVVDDGKGKDDIGTVSLVVNSLNDAPVAVNDEAVTNINEAVTIDVLVNDSDPDNDPLTISTASASSGTATIVENQINYNPTEGFSGTDSINYTITDGQGGSASAVVTVTVNNNLHPPVAVDDSYTLNEDNPLIVDDRDGSQALLTDNDSDPDGDTLTVTSIVTSPEHGELTFDGNGRFVFEPESNFAGTTHFVYQISDGKGGTDTATATLTVTAVNDAPTAVDDEALFNKEEARVINVLANDFDVDGDTITITNAIANLGQVEVLNGQSILYHAPPNFLGNDIIEYNITDGNGGTAFANVNISIEDINEAPKAEDDEAETLEDQTVHIDVLANDSDGNGDPLTVISTTTTNGSTQIDEHNILRFTPNPNFHGDASIVYVISDGREGKDSATVTVHVRPVNDNPIAVADAFTITEDTQSEFNPIINDSDPDGDPLAIIDAQAEHGNVTVNESNSLTYTPAENFHGTVQLTYLLVDNHGGEAQGEITVTVTPVNDAPIAVSDVAAVLSDASVAIDVLSNDSDVDGDPLTISEAIAEQGSTSITENLIVYTPPAGFIGSDTINYTINDGHGGEASARVIVQVGTDEHSPNAVDDQYEIDEDHSLVTSNREDTPNGVLHNDSDPDGDTIRVNGIIVPTKHGDLVITTQGNLNYEPFPNFSGTDSFVYQITDGTDRIDTATVTIVVRNVNDNPTAQDDSYTIDEGGSLEMAVLENDSDVDGDPIRLTDAFANHGTATVSEDGTRIHYQAPEQFHGTDFIEYNITDGHGGTAFANVSITINNINDAPVAVNDIETTSEDHAVIIDVLSNDSDADGDPLHITNIETTNGTTVITPENALEFTPLANFHGIATILYTIRDGFDASDTATVTITVTPVNDDPIAANDAYTIDEDTPIALTPIENDSDIDGDTLSITEAHADHGEVTLGENNTLGYKPPPDFNGTDSVFYTLVDNHGGSATGEITITINAVNDAPRAEDDTLVMREDDSVTIDVLSNDFDPDGDPITITKVEATNGDAAVNDDNVIDFIPTLNFNGLATINYTITDSTGSEDSATVVITVEPVNDNPIANRDNYNINEDTPTELNPISNDSDVDGDPLSITQAHAEHGSVTVNPSNSLSYVPLQDFTGTDTITYTLVDNHPGPEQGTAEGTAIVIVTAVNDAPIALADQATVEEDSSVIIDILANDTDVDGDTLNITAVNSEFGSVSVNDDTSVTAAPANATITFIPLPNFSGQALINYTISDGSIEVSSTVEVAVTPVNDAPTITDTEGSVSENAPNGTVVVTVAAADIDINDTLRFSITTGNTDAIFAIDESSGQITVGNNTFLDFETTPAYVLTVTVTDSGELTATATVKITIENGTENEMAVADISFGNDFISGSTVSNAYALDNADVPVDTDIDSQDRVVIVGTIDNNNLAVTRYLPDGRIDLTFGRQGRLRTDLGSTEVAKAVSIDQTDNIYIAGQFSTGSAIEVFIVKLSPEGQLDTTFGLAGVVFSTMGESNIIVGDVLAHSDGTILVAVSVNSQIRVLQFDSSGTLIVSTIIDLPGDFDQIEAMAEQSDGKVVLAGHTADSANNFTYDFAVARITTTDGLALDTTFNETGMNVFDLGQSKSDMAYAIDLQSQNHIVIIGSFLVTPALCDIGAAVLTPDGILDTNFGIGGIVIIDADGDEGGSTGNSFGTSVWVDGSDNLYIGTQFGMTAADYDFGVVKTSANGTLDTSFGTNGAVRADINDSQNTTAGIVLDAQGRPMVATSGRGVLKHDFALARFTVAGVLDTTFQERGYNLTNQTPSNDILHGAILLEKEPHNGKFVLVGKTTSQGSVTDVLVARFMPNGRLDLAFGVNGYFHLPDTTSGSSYLAQSIVELGDGRLVVAGQYNFNQSFLLMLDTDGKLDTTFAGDGLLLIEPTGSSSTLNSVDVDNDGKIVAVGYQFSASFDLYLIRYNVDGTPDNTFNATGTVIMDMEGGNFEGLKRVSILPDNSLIVVGNYNSQTLVAKFLSNGTLDTAGFNVGVGFQIADVDTTVDDNFDVLYDVSIASDGTIYASGASNGTVSGTDLITVLALNANGTMKTDFGGDGIVTYDFGSGHAAQSLGLDANGKLVLTGHTHNATDGGDDVFIARLTTDGAQDPLFNGGNAQLINYNETDSAEIVGVLPDGRILLGGHNTLTAEQVKVWYLSMFVLEPVAATP